MQILQRVRDMAVQLNILLSSVRGGEGTAGLEDVAFGTKLGGGCLCGVALPRVSHLVGQ